MNGLMDEIVAVYKTLAFQRESLEDAAHRLQRIDGEDRSILPTVGDRAWDAVECMRSAEEILLEIMP